MPEFAEFEIVRVRFKQKKIDRNESKLSETQILRCLLKYRKNIFIETRVFYEKSSRYVLDTISDDFPANTQLTRLAQLEF